MCASTLRERCPDCCINSEENLKLRQLKNNGIGYDDIQLAITFLLMTVIELLRPCIIPT